MSVNKAISGSGYHRRGTAYTKMAFSQGFLVNRAGTDPSFSPSGGIFAPAHDENRSWASGTNVDSTGLVMFDNDVQGGYLREILVANRGPSTVYVGFNSNTVSTTNAFPLASGESMEREGYITSMYAVAVAAGSGQIYAQGLFGTHPRII